VVLMYRVHGTTKGTNDDNVSLNYFVNAHHSVVEYCGS
jgi:hypothetical protein